MVSFSDRAVLFSCSIVDTILSRVSKELPILARHTARNGGSYSSARQWIQQQILLEYGSRMQGDELPGYEILVRVGHRQIHCAREYQRNDLVLGRFLYARSAC